MSLRRLRPHANGQDELARQAQHIRDWNADVHARAKEEREAKAKAKAKTQDEDEEPMDPAPEQQGLTGPDGWSA